MIVFWIFVAIVLICLGLFIFTQGGQNLGPAVVTAGVVILLILLVSPSHAHDHNHPDLDGWFVTLKSGKGYCCDGKDQLHLTDLEWNTQNKPNSHFRVSVPSNKESYAAAMKGEKSYEAVWVDVPDEAVVDEPNKLGEALVWPLYGYDGLNIRCFMPGALI